jgi:hypothetical protein
MKIGKGKLITELVKGSMDYTMQMIRDAFRAQFSVPDPSGGSMLSFYIVECFADYVIVTEWGSTSKLKTDEYYKVTYSRNGEVITFANPDAWEIVELAYQPQSAITESKKKGGTRFEEAIEPGRIELLEAKDEKKGTRRIRINELIVANVINGNRRLYEPEIVEAMVADWQTHLHESAGQGRLKVLTGEADHPTDKGKKRTEYLETVVRWDKLDWDGKRLDIEGDLILTSKGKDVEILMEAGVRPGGSIRGIGESKVEKVNGQKVEKVLWLSMNGVDLVGDPSFKNVAELSESIKQTGDEAMNLEELLKLMRENPEVFKGITEAQIKEMGEKQLKALEEQVRTALGIGAGENITESLKSLKDKSGKFDESQKHSEVETAIAEATKDLPFGEKLNKMFVESLKESSLGDAIAVKQFAESKRKEYGKLAAAGILKSMGFDEKKGTFKVLGDVLENETGTPEYARAGFEITESIRKNEMRAVPSRLNESRAAVWTLQLLERFDKLYQRQLMNESKQFEEQTLTTDLNLPYSVSRAIIAEAFPNLVTANVFDVGVMNGSPERIYFEAFEGETGYTVAITDEVETAGVEGTWYALAHGTIVPGTVVVTSNPAGTTWVEGTDYVIDYELGKIKPIAAGGINGDDVLVDYSYNALMSGENAEIQRAKVTLSYQTMEAAAYRLADYITSEAIVFSRSQLGYDVVARTMANIVRQIRLNIDRVLIEKALGAALSVASNSGGTWTAATDPWALLAEYIGYAKVKVANRYYEPTGILMSETNADLLSNWDGFTRLGFPNALLDAAGFAGAVKGLPVFKSTQMRDGYVLVMNREILLHRVFQPLTIKGPFPTYGANMKLIAAEQYYAEEYNSSIVPIGGKASFVKIA